MSFTSWVVRRTFKRNDDKRDAGLDEAKRCNKDECDFFKRFIA